jgi:signal transduction histidine kinase
MTKKIRLEIESIIREAAFLIENQGEYAFQEFRTQGKFYHDDIYVFVWGVRNNKITRLVFPPDHMGEDIEITNMTDSQGTNITDMVMKIALSPRGEGWSEVYLWKKQGEANDSQKISFIKRVTYKGRMYVVGSGYYLD